MRGPRYFGALTYACEHVEQVYADARIDIDSARLWRLQLDAAERLCPHCRARSAVPEILPAR